MDKDTALKELYCALALASIAFGTTDDAVNALYPTDVNLDIIEFHATYMELRMSTVKLRNAIRKCMPKELVADIRAELLESNSHTEPPTVHPKQFHEANSNMIIRRTVRPVGQEDSDAKQT